MKVTGDARLASSPLWVAWFAMACTSGPITPTETATDTGSAPPVVPTADTAPLDPELPPAPALRNPVTLDDEDLAYQSLILMGHGPLGAKGETCSECHSLNQGLIESWRTMSEQADTECFSRELVNRSDAIAVVNCMRQKPDIETTPFQTPRLGIYSAAAHLDYFDHVFDSAFGDLSPEKADFGSRVAMPRPPLTPWTQEEFDIVAEWFARGTPLVETLLPGAPGPGECVPNITPAVPAHIDRMEIEGWRGVNESNNLLMFGCNGAATAQDCLSTYPEDAGWAHLTDSTVRVLRTNGYSSSYWTRSSADGRFVGHGGGAGGNSSTVIDLATDAEIGADGLYDPAFFPDNSAFIWQATPVGTAICRQNLLSSGVTSVSFQETECSSATQVGLYQHVGEALGGGDFWTVNGAFVSDDGGHGPTLGNPRAFFDENQQITLTPMVYTGTEYEPKDRSTLTIPYEGDTVISRSSELLISRIAGNNFRQNGLSLRRIDATPNGNGYDVQVPVIGTYCINGGKPDISFDDRWMIIHTYVTDGDAQELGFTDANDPGFAQYRSMGAANLYLVDLRTGVTRRVTNMQPGEYALFPHFRSDGWIYFVVRTMSSTEYMAATDAALVLEN